MPIMNHPTGKDAREGRGGPSRSNYRNGVDPDNMGAMIRSAGTELVGEPV